MGKVPLIMYKKKGFLLPLKLEIRVNFQQIFPFDQRTTKNLKYVNSSLFQYVTQLLYGPREQII